MKAPINARYLSDFMDFLPGQCILNKGITGCGGTTLEITSKRDSIILCPTRNLVISKTSELVFPVTSATNTQDIQDYIDSGKQYRKIIATYNALPRIMQLINPKDWFLLIDEYHLLFNDYGFRSDAIIPILNSFREFKDWCFMTATPLSKDCELKELEGIDKITIEWDNAVPVNMKILDTCFIQRQLTHLIEETGCNWHIFINSLTTIQQLIKNTGIDDYRIVCSENNKRKLQNIMPINSPVCKYNFYTSCAFEGTDIYDPIGKCVIVSDTKISTTILDISTKVRQICGRLRDSKYKNECVFIVNTRHHRYAGLSQCAFDNQVKDNERRGLELQQEIENYSQDRMQTAVKLYSQDTYSGLYINKFNDSIFYDQNLKNMDTYNYKLVSEIYNSGISVMMECEKNSCDSNVSNVVSTYKGLYFVYNKLKEQSKDTFSLEELYDMFKDEFKSVKITWQGGKTIKKYFPEFNVFRQSVNRCRQTMYKFKL